VEKSVLIVDDQEHICRDLGKHLQKRNYAVFTAFSKENARKIILAEKPDYAVIDLKLSVMQDHTGIEILNFSERNHPEIKTLILSAYPLDQVSEQLKTKTYQSEKAEQNYVFKGGEKNYIRAVLDKLEELEKQKEKKKCFVLLPFADTKSCSQKEWNDIFQNLIKPAVEESGYDCIKPAYFQEEIVKPVLENLNRSDLLIADLTDQNFHVLYQLGVRHCLREASILITQNMEDVLFESEFCNTLSYGWKFEKEREKFKNDITEKIISANTGSPVQNYLNP